jgi:hypothetical protein
LDKQTGGEKKLNGNYPSQESRKIVEVINFEGVEIEKLALIKRHFGLVQNKEAIKALIAEKCAEIRLTEEKARKRENDEEKALEHLEKGKYTCPEYM